MKLHFEVECLVCHLLRLELLLGGQSTCPHTGQPVATAQSNLYLELVTWTCWRIRGSAAARRGWCSEDNGVKFQTGEEVPGSMES